LMFRKLRSFLGTQEWKLLLVLAPSPAFVTD